MRKLILLAFFLSTIYSQQFTKLTDQVPVTDGGDSRSVNWIDFDGDGDLDLFITNGPRAGENNFLYENDGNGNFIKITDNPLVQDKKSSDGATWGDYNNDGKVDAFVGNWWNQTNLLYKNKGNEIFEFIEGLPSADNSYSETGNWGDFNNDGFLDLMVANSEGAKKDFLFKNNGDGRFTKIEAEPVGTDRTASRNINWIDYDDDGDLDIYVANEGNQKNNLYQNNGDETFTKVVEHVLVEEAKQSFSSSWIDYDNDGDLDLYVVNFANGGNSLYKNNGGGNYEKIVNDPVITKRGFSVTSAWGDVDNGGDLDVLITNAFTSGFKTNNFFFLNNGDGTFTEDGGELTKNNGWTYGASFADINNDGYIDLGIANCFQENENNSIYLNNGGSNNWIKINLEGKISNASALGSIVKIKSMISGKEVTQTRLLSGQDNYCGQSMQIHFGLGDAQTIDSLFVNWPSGQKSVLTKVNANQVVIITEEIPEGYLDSNFKADEIQGGASFTVSFSDLSVSDPNNPITTWEWDFDSDGTPDSFEQNPVYTYSTSESKNVTVSLKVSNGTSESIKLRANYISLDASLVSVENQNELPEEFFLSQNFPNPFNPSTSIKYWLKESSHVKLVVYDSLGRIVSTLLDEEKPAGEHVELFSASSNGVDLTSGVYFYKLSTGEFNETRKMIVLK